MEILNIDGSIFDTETGKMKSEMEIFLEKKEKIESKMVQLPKCYVFGCRVQENGEHTKQHK